MPKEPMPTHRGLEPGLTPNTSTSTTPKTNIVTAPVFTYSITEIISFKAGYLKVKCVGGVVQERKGGTISWRNNNPGNLKYGDFAKTCGAVGVGHGGHAVFPDYDTGLKAQKILLFTNQRGYNVMSILNALKKYAPVSDPAFKNEPAKYAAFVAKKLGVKDDTMLYSLTQDQQVAMIKAMSAYEGWKEGTITTV